MNWEAIGSKAHEVATLWLQSEHERGHPESPPSPGTEDPWPEGTKVIAGDYGPAIGVPEMARRLGVSERRLRAIAKDLETLTKSTPPPQSLDATSSSPATREGVKA